MNLRDAETPTNGDDLRRAFETQPYVSVVVMASFDAKPRRVRATGLLRGRMVRVGGKATHAEVDLVNDALVLTGRTTLVPARDVDPLTSRARLQMMDVGGHFPSCGCSVHAPPK